LLCLTGCGSLIERIAPDAVRDAKSYYELLRQHQGDQIIQSFDPRADKDTLRGQLVNVMALVPQEQPLSVDTLGASFDCKASGFCTKEVTLEYKYSDRLILFRSIVSNQSGHYAILNLHVEPESVPLASISRFSLRGKGLDHYIILLAALISVGVAAFALVLCIRTPIQKRKWLWAIVIIVVSIGKFGIEWASGEVWYRLAYLSILPAGFGFDSESPFIYASIPVGAILFLLLRGRLMGAGEPAPPAANDVTAAIAGPAETGPPENTLGP
jgi:hypothetical protein